MGKYCWKALIMFMLISHITACSFLGITLDPASEADQVQIGTGTVLVSLNQPGNEAPVGPRTLWPDWDSAGNGIDDYRVVLSKAGETDRETIIPDAGGTAAFSDVPAGTWTATAYGRREESPGVFLDIARGSVGVPVDAGKSVTAQVTLAYLQESSGAYTLRVEWPSAEPVDALLYRTSLSGSFIELSSFLPQEDGSQAFVLMEGSAVVSGDLPLFIRLLRTNGTSANRGELLKIFDHQTVSETIAFASSDFTIDLIAPVISEPAITVTNIAETSADISWTAASDNFTATPELMYRLVIASSTTELDTLDEAKAITGAGIIMDWSTVLPSGISGLTADTGYACAVLVRDLAENMALYTPVAFTTTASAPVPAAPESFSATADSDTQITLSWDASGVTTETGFEIQRDTQADFNGEPWDFTAAADAESYVDSDTLAASTDYYYRIRSVNAAGESGWVVLPGDSPVTTLPYPDLYDEPDSWDAIVSDLATYLDGGTELSGFDGLYVADYDEDWYRFTVPDDGSDYQYTIQTKAYGGSSVDTVLEVYASDQLGPPLGSVVAADDNSGESGIFSLIGPGALYTAAGGTLTKGNTYYIRVTANSGAAGKYTLSFVEETPTTDAYEVISGGLRDDEFNDSGSVAYRNLNYIHSVGQVPIEDYVQVSRELTPEDYDYVVFEADPYQTYQIWCGWDPYSDPPPDFNLYYYDYYDGGSLTFIENDEDSDGYIWEHEWTVTDWASDMYYFVVEVYSYGEDTGAYTLMVSDMGAAVPDDPNESNDNPDEATGYGSEFSPTILSSSTDYDVFLLGTYSQDTVLHIEISNNGSESIDASLYDYAYWESGSGYSESYWFPSGTETWEFTVPAELDGDPVYLELSLSGDTPIEYVLTVTE